MISKAIQAASVYMLEFLKQSSAFTQSFSPHMKAWSNLARLASEILRASDLKAFKYMYTDLVCVRVFSLSLVFLDSSMIAN